MSQQINLFNPIFLKQQKHFSAMTMLQALGLLLLGSLLLGAYAHYQVTALSQEAAAASSQLAILQAQVAKAKAEGGGNKKNVLLEEQVRKREAEVQSLQQISALLQRGDFGDTKGYSQYLSAFARQIVGDLWLTGLNIQGAGNEIGLRGRALQPELVAVYMNRLKNEPVLQGKSFSTLEMQVPSIDSPSDKNNPTGAKQSGLATYIEFSLQSSVSTKEPGDVPGAKVK